MGNYSHWLPVIVAFAAAVLLTPIVRVTARHFGIVAKPKPDRWHQNPTAMLGGVGIFLAVNLTIFLFTSHFNRAVLLASGFLFALGLLDDIKNLKPYQKLIGQIMAATIVVYSGLLLPWTGSTLFNMAVTLFWLVGVTNAVNMLDNMDGLAGGIAAIAGGFLAVNFSSLGQTTEAVVVAIFVAATIGFLLYNSHPASIFMGDSGSMFIGFFLASSALLTTTSGRTRSFLPVIAVPVLMLVIPIFDTTFVTLLRKLSGRPASHGGRDHTSHRLVALGLSEQKAVWLLYGLGGLSGLLALYVRRWPLYESVAAILGFTVVLTMCGVYLAGVKVHAPDYEMHDNRLIAFLIDISYKRRVFETLLDVALIWLAYYLAYVLRFAHMITGDPNLNAFVRTVPIVVFVKIGVFLAVGVYRGLWRYTGLHDLVNLGRAVLLASVAAIVVIVYVFRFEGFSRSVFVLDGLLLITMVTGSRVAFRVARRMLPRADFRYGHRVLIYGAGDAGELLLRELLNNYELRYAPVGFLDDDTRKVGKVIHGLRVYAGDMLPSTCEQLGAQEILISSSKLPHERVLQIIANCDRIGIPLRQMHIQLVTINSWRKDILLDIEHPAPNADIIPLLRVRGYGSTNVLDPGPTVRPDHPRDV